VAQTIAALSLVVSPLPLILFGFFSMNCFEILLWSTACWMLVEIGRSGDARLWVPLGIVLGLALVNKHTAGLFVAGVAVVTLATPLRRHALGGWLWLGALVAALIVLPNIVWQAANDWPSLEFYRNLDRESNIPIGPLAVLGEQIATWNPGTLPVWLAGSIFFFSARGQRYRALGWLFLTLLAIVVVLGKSRPDRIMGVYPVLFAAGGVLLEGVSRRERRRWVQYAVPGLLLVTGILGAPLLLPFSPELMARHPLAAGTNDARREVDPAPIPIWFSHRMGSEGFVNEVAAVFEGLSPAERRDAIVLSGDFAHAGAIEHLGPRHSLPRVFSPHNSYYLWKPEPGLSPSLVIAIGLDEGLLRKEFGEVELAALYRCAYCMGWRDDLPIYVARSPRRPLLELWPGLKRFGLPTRKLILLGERDRES